MGTVIQVDVVAVTFLLGSVIPLLVALVAKLGASSRVKAALNTALSFVAGALAYVALHNGAFTIKGLVVALGTTFISSGTFYNHLWKPVGAAGALAQAVPGGIGAAARPVSWSAAQATIGDVHDIVQDTISIAVKPTALVKK